MNGRALAAVAALCALLLAGCARVPVPSFAPPTTASGPSAPAVCVGPARPG